jgi:two-component system chemotaxis response regulator CheY
LGLILSDLGVEYVEAADGQQAWDLLQQDDDIDVVFVDWNMPTMDGLEFVRRVRSSPRYDGLRMLMVSVNSSTSDLTVALQAGVSDYLMKPFDKPMVKSKLQLMGSLV